VVLSRDGLEVRAADAVQAEVDRGGVDPYPDRSPDVVEPDPDLLRADADVPGPGDCALQLHRLPAEPVSALGQHPLRLHLLFGALALDLTQLLVQVVCRRVDAVVQGIVEVFVDGLIRCLVFLDGLRRRHSQDRLMQFGGDVQAEDLPPLARPAA
jgi:hypothetical protein